MDKREELRQKLRYKLYEKKMQRSSNEVKNEIISKSFDKNGVDLEKLKKDLEEVKKAGGLEFKL